MKSNSLIRLLIVDHHAIVSSGIATILNGYADLEVVAKTRNVENIFELCEQHHPELILMDIDLPDENHGIEIIRLLRQKYSDIRVLVLTNLLEEALLLEALRVGVTSYLMKDLSSPELVAAIRNAYLGRPTLSPEATSILIRVTTNQADDSLSDREYQVLGLIARGYHNEEIALQLSISLSTVQFHVRNILSKLKVHNRTEAAAFAIRRQLRLDGKIGISRIADPGVSKRAGPRD